MDANWKFVFSRLDNLEVELAELREATWPVCQGLVDKQTGPFQNMKEKRRFFKFLDLDEIRKLLRLKAKFMGISQDLIYEELRQIRVEAPRVPDE
jgi:hypothetical protein